MIIQDKIIKKLEKKWDLIDKSKYPLSGEFEIVVDDFAPSMKVVGYSKDGIQLFYFRHGTMFFYPANWSHGISAYMVFNSVLDTIEKYLKKSRFSGKVGFELSNFNSLNNVVLYFINRRGFEVEIDNKYIVVNFK